MGTLLFEIGTDDLPNWCQEIISQEINYSEYFDQTYKEYPIVCTKVYTTPRRIAFLIDLKSNMTNETPIYGPSHNLIKDKDGNYTPTAHGFAKKYSVSVEDILKENNLAFIKIPSKPILGTIQEFLKQILNFINAQIYKFAEKKYLSNTNSLIMRWERSKIKFNRPIRWLVAMLDDQEIDLSNLVKSLNLNLLSPNFKTTFGHRLITSNKKIIINHASNYEKLLLDHYVILDNQKRFTHLVQQIKIKKKIKFQWEQFERSSFLSTEYPILVIGKFDKKYLKLPPELINTILVFHQKCSSVINNQNELIPEFAFVIDCQKSIEDANKNPNIIKHLEKTIGARLEDGLFFYNKDLENGFKHWEEKINNLTFLKGLGTYGDRIKRLSNIVKALENMIPDKQIQENLQLAIKYYKLDLCSYIVDEFPELQGQIGAHYVEKLKTLPDDVIEAIRNQNNPGFNDTNRWLWLFDAFDTIVGCWLIDEKPTGSSDLFGLRSKIKVFFNLFMETNNIVNTKFLEMIDLKKIVSVTLKEYNFTKVMANSFMNSYTNDILKYLFNYFKNSYVFHENSKEFNIIYNSLGKKFSKISNFHNSLSALINFYEKKNGVSVQQFEKLETILSRCRNILLKNNLFSNQICIDEALFTEPEEKNLYNVYIYLFEKYSNNDIHEMSDYEEFLNDMCELFDPIENFFKNIIVICDDEKIKNNRLMLLQKIFNFTSQEDPDYSISLVAG